MKWMFLATQPFTRTDWGVEASFNSHGKSFDSAISFRYAPGKNPLSSFTSLYPFPFPHCGTSTKRRSFEEIFLYPNPFFYNLSIKRKRRDVVKGIKELYFPNPQFQEKNLTHRIIVGIQFHRKWSLF